MFIKLFSKFPGFINEAEKNLSTKYIMKIQKMRIQKNLKCLQLWNNSVYTSSDLWMQSQDSAKSMHCVLLFVYNKLYSTETCVQWKNVQVPMNFFASSFHCSPLPWYWWKLFFLNSLQLTPAEAFRTFVTIPRMCPWPSWQEYCPNKTRWWKAEHYFMVEINDTLPLLSNVHVWHSLFID